ncbi:MAG: hypothetical protein IKO52_05135 [Clostridia bacterium]|nr:hypothetical protein [Clostridia bacterium]
MYKMVPQGIFDAGELLLDALHAKMKTKTNDRKTGNRYMSDFETGGGKRDHRRTENKIVSLWDILSLNPKSTQMSKGRKTKWHPENSQ